jgi:hypothetical protein
MRTKPLQRFRICTGMQRMRTSSKRQVFISSARSGSGEGCCHMLCSSINLLEVLVNATGCF